MVLMQWNAPELLVIAYRIKSQMCDCKMLVLGSIIEIHSKHWVHALVQHLKWWKLNSASIDKLSNTATEKSFLFGLVNAQIPSHSLSYLNTCHSMHSNFSIAETIDGIHSLERMGNSIHSDTNNIALMRNYSDIVIVRALLFSAHFDCLVRIRATGAQLHT